MAKYGRIKVENISLDDKMFNKVCDTLKLITNHYYQDDKTFYIYGIDDDKTEYSVDCGAITKLSSCYIHAIRFYIRNFPCEVENGLLINYIV